MPRKNSWFSVRAEAEARTVHVAVRGVIGEWGVTDRDLIAQIEAAGEVDEIHVSINSRGGDVDHALSIYDYLRSHPALVSVRVTGIAASSGSIIAMAGDTITMPANTLMMVHRAWSCVCGNDDAMSNEADVLRKINSALMETYKARTGKSEDEIKDLLVEEKWLTAAEAKELGFADVVEPLKASASVAMAEALQVPAEVLAKVAAIEAYSVKAELDAHAEAEGEQRDAVQDGAEQDEIETTSAAIAAMVARAGLETFASAILLDERVTDTASAAVAISEAREIRDLCAFAGHADQAAGFIQARKSLTEVRAALINARAAEDHPIDKTIPMPAAAGDNEPQPTAGVKTSAIWSARNNHGGNPK